jgi:hypothetical protein
MSTPLRERPDAPLGTLIFRAGLLPAETIENALEEGVKTGRRLGEILIERGLLQEEDLTRLLAGQKGLPFVSLRAERIDTQAVGLLSEDQARLFSALPIRLEEGLPLVAVADPTNDVLNRNIREALGQEVRFVVAGRTELNEVITEAYSGTLQTSGPVAQEPELSPEPAPLRVDTSVPPIDEPVRQAYEAEAAPEPAADPLPDPVVETEPPVEAAPLVEAEPVVEAEPEAQKEPGPAPEPQMPAAPEPAFDPAAYEPDPAPIGAPEPELEPVATVEHAPTPVAFDPPAPAYEEPAPAEPEAVEATPLAPEALPQTNGHLPHDFEDDLLPQPAAEDPPAVPATPVAQTAPEPTVSEATIPEAPAAEAPLRAAPAAAGSGFRVSIRLTSGERITVSECADLAEAKGYARALTKQLAATDPDDWPFVNGRFLKPDTIVSVDVEES